MGSLLSPTSEDIKNLKAELSACETDLLSSGRAARVKDALAKCESLARRFDVVVANPPYMGSSSFNPFMSGWIKKNYPDSKSDLCTCFIERVLSLAAKDGFSALVTSDTCMYLSSFETLRNKLIDKNTLLSLVDTRGTNAHPDVFDANAVWVLQNGHQNGYEGAYFKLNHRIGEKDAALLEAIKNPACGWFYRRNAETFHQIPGSPIAYWLPGIIGQLFETGNLSQVFESAGRLKTHNNSLFVRNWWEVSSRDYECCWMPFSNGGGFSRWGGLAFDVVDWKKEAVNHYSKHGGLPNAMSLGREGICWGLITSSDTSFRYKPAPNLFSSGSPTIILKTGYNHALLNRYLAFLNSSICKELLRAFNPTLNTTVGDVLSLPALPEGNCYSKTEELSACCRGHVSHDWDSLEISWDFKRSPLV